MEYAEQVRAHLNELIAPLVNDLDAIEGQISAEEASLAALKQTRQVILGVLAKVDPETYGPKPKQRPQTPGKQIVTAEEVRNVQTWLEANPPNGEGIWASRLMDDEEFREATKVRSGVVTQALAELHEQSFLTLDKIGRGGSRIYKVVT